jgi:hypothetical protein
MNCALCLNHTSEVKFNYLYTRNMRRKSMTDLFSEEFIQALKSNDLNAVRKISKSDLHKHFFLGGDRRYIKSVAGFDIPYFNPDKTSNS